MIISGWPPIFTIIIIVFVSTSIADNHPRLGYVSRIQKSAGITVVDVESSSSPIVDDKSNETGTYNNASEAIEHVLTRVVQTSMLEMMRKLSSSLRNVFDRFNPGDRHGDSQTLDRQSRRGQIVSGSDTVVDPNFDSIIDSTFDPGSASYAERNRPNESIKRKSVMADPSNELGDAKPMTSTSNATSEYLQWWLQTALTDMIWRGNSFFGSRLHSAGLPSRSSAPDRSNFTVHPANTTDREANRSLDYDGLSAKNDSVAINATLLSNTSDYSTAEITTTISSIPLEVLTTTTTITTVPVTSSMTENATTSESTVATSTSTTTTSTTTSTASTSTSTASTSTTSTTTTTAQTASTLSQTTTDTTTSTGSTSIKADLLITGKPLVNISESAAFKRYQDQDRSISLTSVQPRDDLELGTTSSLLVQTIFISVAAAFAILVFAVSGVILACYRRRRGGRRPPIGPMTAFGRWSSRLGSKVVPSLTSGSRVFPPEVGAAMAAAAAGAASKHVRISDEVTVDSCNRSPYYYDSSRSDWSLISKDRQVDTYLSCIGVLDAKRDLTSIGPSLAPSVVASIASTHASSRPRLPRIDQSININ